MKNFNPSWNEQDLRAFFSRYGDIKSVFIALSKDREGNEKPFAFVCFDKEGDANYGAACADKAVADTHGKEVDGFTIYAQAAVPESVR